MANQAINEMKVTLGGKEYTLCPTFQAISQIEDLSNKGGLQMLLDFSKNNIRTKDVTAIIYGGIYGAHHRDGTLAAMTITFDEIGETIVRDGLQKHIMIAAQFLAGALVGDPEAEKKTQVAATT